MDEITIFVKEATLGPQIQQIEDIVNSLDGVIRVLIDTTDGEIKVEFDRNKISGENIEIAIWENDYHII